MKTPTDPPDQPARDAIRTDLDETMFVEAGAGSGKTKSLVDRFAARPSWRRAAPPERPPCTVNAPPSTATR